MKARRTKTEGEQWAIILLFVVGFIGWLWGWLVALGIGLLAVGLVGFVHGVKEHSKKN